MEGLPKRGDVLGIISGCSIDNVGIYVNFRWLSVRLALSLFLTMIVLVLVLVMSEQTYSSLPKAVAAPHFRLGPARRAPRLTTSCLTLACSAYK